MGGLSSKNNSFEAKHCTPLGLYECEWDKKTLRKLICDKKLAPITKGSEQPAEGLDECPICFLYYPCGLNRARCCNQEICSECALQIRKPSTPAPCCPFCNAKNFTTVFRGVKSEKERAAEEEERRKVQEAKERMVREERERERAKAEKQREEEEQRLAQRKEEEEEAVVEQSEVEDGTPAANVATLEPNGAESAPEVPSSASGIPDDAFGVGGPTFDFSNYDGPPEELEEWMIRVAMRMSLAQPH
mmetsp:Transcript_2658/g.9433  ORF Transcript_2658/g.9433 Transcript_2658/m.9433 type:complete len:246 (-) Transcript_2658:112-849(-)|eukprot:CAMPEP_0114616402 /NCGR_PEP_ID=MMETSP0168-20121206/6669_1 /TAXON_ID=95228 ORGANISM="Vannella sp., Strain DIVA3 517/6/12" /NCGR_SAMPLE_ID=MMETSP0168 /ASSEMBLY_ACC=CAM_ASM_000044 /LENGTH=245 /DNA_ID=CAMNT_0001827517 /DNA_START=135 /DNA_END=872 /DNA_ORIENTATION=+